MQLPEWCALLVQSPLSAVLGLVRTMNCMACGGVKLLQIAILSIHGPLRGIGSTVKNAVIDSGIQLLEVPTQHTVQHTEGVINMEARQEAAWNTIKVLSLTAHGRILMQRELADPECNPQMRPVYEGLLISSPVWAKADEN